MKKTLSALLLVGLTSCTLPPEITDLIHEKWGTGAYQLPEPGEPRPPLDTEEVYDDPENPDNPPVLSEPSDPPPVVVVEDETPVAPNPPVESVMPENPPIASPVEVCGDFRDGGWGSLWKPHSESTGTPVILMSEKGGMSVELEPLFWDRNGNQVTCAPRDDCTQKRSNEHNPDNDGTPRAHWWLFNSADWWAERAPITVRWYRGGELIDCRRVDDPRKRYD